MSNSSIGVSPVNYESHHAYYAQVLREMNSLGTRSLYYQHSRKEDMSSLDSAKIKHLHKKILERFLENPSAADEELLELFDFKLVDPLNTYRVLGQTEHPVFSRSRWISEAAANLTDDGYGVWLKKNLDTKKTYRLVGDVISVIDDSPEPIWPYETATTVTTTFPPPPAPTIAPQTLADMIRDSAILTDMAPSPFANPRTAIAGRAFDPGADFDMGRAIGSLRASTATAQLPTLPVMPAFRANTDD